MRRTRIVCTLGPATESPELHDQLLAAGLDCVRLNFSHGTHESHARMARNLRAAAERAGRPIAILADLAGPKLRVEKFPGGPVELLPGARFVLTTEDVPGTVERCTVSYAPLPRDVKPGDPILLDDGRLRFRVVKVSGCEVICEVEIGGTLSDRKGLNLPGVALSTPALSDKDRVDAAFAVDVMGVDAVALSFVRRPEDLLEARPLCKGALLIAKIEKPEAVACLGDVLDASDGAIVARGDLGVELGPEKVPMLQKRIIREVNRRGKVVMTATQMLDSMVSSTRPTRAEVSDVANAVLDGTDAVMLSNETASGRYPIEALKMMDTIVREVERETPWEGAENPVLQGDWSFKNGAARAAAVMSRTLPLAAVVVITRSGSSAGLLSEHRPRCPVLALTPDVGVAQRMAVGWGIVPRVEPLPLTGEAQRRVAIARVLELGLARPGQTIALVAGFPPERETNGVQLIEVEA